MTVSRAGWLTPGDERYDELRWGINRAVDSRPVAVVAASDTTQIRDAVEFASRGGHAVAALATGHGPSVAYDDAVLVNTGRLRSVCVDPDRRLAVAAAGARWGDVITAAAPFGLAPLNGSSPNVGVVGYLLGGGSGHLGRRWGYGADHVTGIDIVTAEAVVESVTTDSDPKLFWALRGAGANFGVVTQIEFDLFAVDRLYGGELVFPAHATHDVVGGYADWVASASEEVATSLLLIRYPDLDGLPEPLRGRFAVHVRFAHSGPDLAQGPELARPLRALGPAMIDTITEMPYRDVGSIHHDPVDAPYQSFEGNLLLGPLDARAVTTLVDGAGPDSGAPFLAELRHLGGAYARPPAVPNCVGGRDATFSLYSATGTDADHRAGRAAFESAMSRWVRAG